MLKMLNLEGVVFSLLVWGQQTRDTIYMTYQDPHHPIFVAEATAMRCVSALKSLKALTLADHWRRPPFSQKLVVGKYLLKPTSWDVCPWTEIHVVYLYWGSPKWHCHHLGFVFLFPYTAHFFHASYRLKKPLWVVGLRGSNHQRHPARTLHGAAVIICVVDRSVDGFTMGCAGVPKITLGEFCFRCSHDLRCFHFGSFDVNLFGWIWVLWLITAPCFFWQRWFWLVVGFFG